MAALGSLLLVFSAQGQSDEPLTAERCLLIYNVNVPASKELAEHYARQRGVPADQVWGVKLSEDETISYEAYERFAETVRARVRAQDVARRALCLVLFYGLPLKVAARNWTAEDRSAGEKRHAERERAAGEALESLLAAGEEEARRLTVLENPAEKEGKPASPGEDEKPPRQGESPPTAPVCGQETASEKGAAPEDELQRRFARYLAARSAWAEGAMRLPTPDRFEANEKLLDWVRRMEGLGVVVTLLENAQAANRPVNAAQLEQLKAQKEEADRRLFGALRVWPGDDRYEEALKSVATVKGLLGVSFVLGRDREKLSCEDSQASFDSELSLVLWPSYDRGRWQDNPIQRGPHRIPTAWLADYPVMMVARIDGPTPEVARRIIDDSLRVEAEGLAGTFYIDARGLNRDDLYSEYDRDLRRMADWLRQKTEIKVVLDNKPELFSAKTCPDAALYCGWYGLANYVPALDLRPGSVAVHIASFEMVSLRESRKAYWCAGLLKDGAAATFGPTAEPYLHAFPKPTEFFLPLLTGRPTLVECYYDCLPFLSWQMALVGDPLYRPFAKKPALDPAEAIGPAPVGPAPVEPHPDSAKP